MDEPRTSTRTLLRALLVTWFAFSCAGCTDAWLAPPEALSEREPASESPQAIDKAEGSTSTSAKATNIPWDQRAIGRDSWRLNLVDTRSTLKPRFRWRHVELESPDGALLIEQSEVVAALDAELPLAAANAKLLLARQALNDKESSADIASTLAAFIRRQSLPITLRRAAVDTLAEISTSQAELASLLAEQAKYAVAGGGPYVPELHEELLRAAARSQSTEAAPAFLSALGAQDENVRLAAVEFWRDGKLALPNQLADLSHDSDARVRRAVLECLALHAHPRALEAAKDALYDGQMEVHLAAIRALGRIPGDESLTILRKEAQGEGNMLRATANAALAERGDMTTVLAAAEDKNSQVRLAAAEALAKCTPTEGSAVAKTLLADRSMAVRRAVIESLSAWPLSQAAPLYLEALGDRATDTRQTAAKALTARWPAGGEFRPTAQADVRERQLAELRQQLFQELGAVAEPNGANTPAANDSVAVDKNRLRTLLATMANTPASDATHRQALAELASMPGAVEQALATMTDEEGVYLPEDIYTAVLRDQSGEFFRDWPAATAAERRTLLAGLTGSLAAGPERPLVMRRVIVLVLLESDPLLWQTALEACRTARDAEVRRFAAAALGHESAEVRRRACEYFRAYPAPDAIAWLQATMNDETNFVAAAAARALPLCGRPESLDDLASLLNRPDADCRLASGTALAQFGDERGRAALERLAYDPDPAIRIRAAQAMGELGDEEFTATLIALLDDDLGVQRVALASLPEVTGHDMPQEEASAPQQQRVAAWKRWAESR